MKKITNYLMKFGAFMILGMTVFVIMDSFEKQATPLMWGIVLITTAWFAYSTEFGGEDE
ncbi:hypothetical protein [Lactococcus formosensis]|uniref:hypothetical protein n=1 Tax=Lactococcus formosensis TaxID=1281486 RepID=UPI003267BBCD